MRATRTGRTLFAVPQNLTQNDQSTTSVEYIPTDTEIPVLLETRSIALPRAHSRRQFLLQGSNRHFVLNSCCHDFQIDRHHEKPSPVLCSNPPRRGNGLITRRRVKFHSILSSACAISKRVIFCSQRNVPPTTFRQCHSGLTPSRCALCPTRHRWLGGRTIGFWAKAPHRHHPMAPRQESNLVYDLAESLCRPVTPQGLLQNEAAV